MKLEQFYKKNKSLVWIFLIIVGLLFLMGNELDDTKKEAGGTRTLAGVGMIIAGGILFLTGVGAVPGTIMIGVGILTLSSGAISLFSPTPTIPTWAYLVGFFAIILMIKKK